jgi:TRAP-type C4-dicarboxylate transport system substrate-binding protein
VSKGKLMKTPFSKILVIVGLFCLIQTTASALTLKIASVAPEATPWGAALNKLSADWSRISNGEITLKIFHNSIAGNEADMLRKLKIGQLQGAVFTSFGLNTITPEILTMSAPLLIADNEELDYVLEKNRGIFEKKMLDKGFVVLAWSKAGWVRFFSKKPVFVPDDLKKQKLSTDPSEVALSGAFKSLGYQLVPVNLGETLVALSSGMVDAIYTSPLAAGGMQFFGVAKNMVNLDVAPFLGAIVLSTSVWDKIPADLQTKLLENSRSNEKELDSQIVQLENSAIKSMEKYGLVVNNLSPAQYKLWEQDAAEGLPRAMGTSFDKETFDRISDQVKAFRAAKKK